MDEKTARAQEPVKSITILIEWKKNPTWGRNPHAKARIEYQSGKLYFRGGYKCSGCGYDKESTVIAHIFNDFLTYRLWQKFYEISSNEKNWPYGINHYTPDNFNFEGGVGTSSYYHIAEFIGGRFNHLIGSNNIDVYQFNMEVKK